MKKLLALTTAIALSLAAAVPAKAAKIEYWYQGPTLLVSLTGKIGLGDFARFKAAAATTAGPISLFLTSNGGAMVEAMMIGELVRERKMTTFVLANDVCASACALIWLSGSDRIVEPKAAIGFHAASDAATGKESGAGSAMMGAFLMQLGYSYRAIEWVASAAPDKMVWLQPKAKELGITFKVLN